MAGLGRGQADIVQQQRIVPATAQKQKGHAAEQIAPPAEGQQTLGIEREVRREFCRPDAHAGHKPVRHIGKRSNFGKLRTTDVHLGTQRQRVEIVPRGKRAPFHSHIAPLSSEAFVPRSDDQLSDWGLCVCSKYCTGVLH